MTQLVAHEEATGACSACGKDAEGSKYWTPLSDRTWAVLRPIVAPLYRDEHSIQNALFIPPYSKPFCSPECAKGVTQ